MPSVSVDSCDTFTVQLREFPLTALYVLYSAPCPLILGVVSGLSVDDWSDHADLGQQSDVLRLHLHHQVAVDNIMQSG